MSSLPSGCLLRRGSNAEADGLGAGGVRRRPERRGQLHLHPERARARGRARR